MQKTTYRLCNLGPFVLWIKMSFLSALFFILYHFRWHCNSWEVSKHHTLWKIWSICFPLLAFTHAKNKCDTVIPSGDICAQQILQSNWLKAFLAIIQEQFPQIWDLYCKIDNKIKFYLKTFPAKPMTKFFKINEKPYFGVILEHIWVFWSTWNFSKKIFQHL